MQIIAAIILGLVQGITEFFPVSSSAHLQLIPELFKALGMQIDFSFQDKYFDISLHVATFLTLIIIFRDRIIRILKKLFVERDTRAIVNLVLSTIPTAVAGVIMFLLDIDDKQSNLIIVINLIVIGILLIVVEQLAQGKKIKQLAPEKYPESELPQKSAFIIGLFQVVSLIKGVSRSGSTLIGGVAVGLTKHEALDYAFLVSLPVYVLLTASQALSIFSGKLAFNPDTLLLTVIGSVTAFLTGLVTIAVFRNFVRHQNALTAFGIYRILLGVLCAIVLL
jgi:undecaprenyl-diphosphatase